MIWSLSPLQKVTLCIQKNIVETNRIIDDGLTEIYINGVVDDGTQIANIMKVFTTDESCDTNLFLRQVL